MTFKSNFFNKVILLKELDRIFAFYSIRQDRDGSLEFSIINTILIIEKGELLE